MIKKYFSSIFILGLFFAFNPLFASDQNHLKAYEDAEIIISNRDYTKWSINRLESMNYIDELMAFSEGYVISDVKDLSMNNIYFSELIHIGSNREGFALAVGPVFNLEKENLSQRLKILLEITMGPTSVPLYSKVFVYTVPRTEIENFLKTTLKIQDFFRVGVGINVGFLSELNYIPFFPFRVDKIGAKSHEEAEGLKYRLSRHLGNQHQRENISGVSSLMKTAILRIILGDAESVSFVVETRGENPDTLKLLKKSGYVDYEEYYIKFPNPTLK